jgi:hypothetical protein
MVKPEINSPAERTPAPHRLNKNNEIWFRAGRASETNPAAISSKLSLMERNQDAPG